ncbi:MAG: ATP-dependent helicase, partial [Desulfomonilia bacterium]|nr:ATP-dependent helicase [Desulfomonilia bacterium]
IRVFRDDERDLLFGAEASLQGTKREVKVSVAGSGSSSNPGSDTLLNDEQLKAVGFQDGFLVVHAGPGTGKTRVLVERIKALKKNDDRTSILAVTFTTRAAAEIAQRLGREDVDVNTFHGLASRILRGSGRSFVVADDAMLRDEAKELGRADAESWVRDLLFRMSTRQPLLHEQAAFVETLRRKGLFPFEGLIEEAVATLRTATNRPRWNHVLVDEFQDINPVQYLFFRELGGTAESIMVIGDANQAIYGFRGSTPEAFDDVLRDYPRAHVLRLEETYRMSSPLSRASNAFIGATAVRSLREGETIRLVESPVPNEFIAREIESLVGGLRHSAVACAQAEYALSDIAVIVRTQQQAQPVLEALDRASIPYDTAYARSLSEKPGIAERIMILEGKRWHHLVRGVGEKAQERMNRGEDPGRVVTARMSEAVHLMNSLEGSIRARIRSIEDAGLFKLERIDDAHPFYQYAGLFGSDLDGFIDFCRLSNDQGALGGERVHVITAHAAKGLEFRCVFIPSLMHGLFPLEGSSVSEERNLFYVAMTRASEILYLLCPDRNQSEFLWLLPAQFCRVYREKRRQSSEQMLLF